MQSQPLRLVNDASQPSRLMEPDGHVVQFFEHDDFLVDAVVNYLADGLVNSQPCVVIATEARREAFLARLGSKGFDTARLIEAGRLELHDAHDALAEFMIVNSPGPQRFAATIGGIIARVSRSNGNATVRAYGEMVDVLWRGGNQVGALRLEELWNALTETHDFKLFCSYAMGSFYKAADAESLRAICERHTHVRPLESPEGVEEAERRREMGAVQARVLELEQQLRQRETKERELAEALRRLAIKPVS